MIKTTFLKLLLVSICRVESMASGDTKQASALIFVKIENMKTVFFCTSMSRNIDQRYLLSCKSIQILTKTSYVSARVNFEP